MVKGVGGAGHPERQGMNIEELIKREAPRDDIHDRSYAKELRAVWLDFSRPLDVPTIKFHLELARSLYVQNSTHYNTALCVVLAQRLKEAERKENEGNKTK